MNVLTKNKNFIFPLLTLATFFSLYLVAGAQGTISVAGEAAATSEEGATSGEGSVGAEGRDPNAYPSNNQRPAVQDRLNERQANLEERSSQVSDRLEARQEIRTQEMDQRQEDRASSSEQRQETRAQNIEQRQALRIERQNALQNVRQQRVLNLSANISNRMDAAIERLFDIISRTELRIDKLKAAGVNTTAAEVKLRESAQLLAEARASISDIDNVVYSATTSAEPKTSWERVKAIYQETGRLIRASHQALREVIALLKTAVAEAGLNNSAAVRSETSVEATTTTTAE